MMNTTDNFGCQLSEETEEDDQSQIIIHVAMGMVALLSVCGTIGNAAVIFVFYRQKHKLSSTIFILTLALTDFITSLITMPYTVVMELLNYDIVFDFPCKLYQFMKTTTIPFSAFVMVAIALDRYLCIVYPFKHLMNIRRAKITVLLLSVLAFTIGILCSLMIGTFHYQDLPDGLCVLDANHPYTGGSNLNATVLGRRLDDIDDSYAMKKSSNKTFSRISELIQSGKCRQSTLIFDKTFVKIYQRLYSSLFGVCALFVIILYCLTYKSVLAQRRKRFNLHNKCCGLLSNDFTTETNTECTQVTEFVTRNKDDNSAVPNETEHELSNSALDEKTHFRESTSTNDASVNDIKRNATTKLDVDSLARPGGVSRAKLKKLRVANIKTALMLSIVAFIYIVAFAPAWMMALGVLHMNVIVYYLYFTYNVANPVIYVFLNTSFRTHLQTMFRCYK